jgi:hypothetical protein
MAGYSGTPLPKKLGIRAAGPSGSGASRVRLVAAPGGFAETLGPFVSARGEADVIVLFSKSARDLHKAFALAMKSLQKNGGLWVAWPKKASGVATDLDENAVREAGLSFGLVDNKVCAIDEVWSGLRFVVRLRDR